MKYMNNIIGKKFYPHFLMGMVSLFVLISVPQIAFSATNNGCDDEDNSYINAELALCSTHVYNLGNVTNPTTDTERQLMRDVVALKTTVMTQQMYAQYEYLEAMLRRFKTQLKKAVLTTSLQAAGATDADGNGGTGGGSSGYGTSGGYYNSNQNIVLTGANDCMAQNDKNSVISCLQNNLSLIRNAVASGNVGEAYRQLTKDVDAASTWQLFIVAEKATDTVPTVCIKASKENPNGELRSTKKSVEACIRQFNVDLANAKEHFNKANSNPWGQMMGLMGGK